MPNNVFQGKPVLSHTPAIPKFRVNLTRYPDLVEGAGQARPPSVFWPKKETSFGPYSEEKFVLKDGSNYFKPLVVVSRVNKKVSIHTHKMAWELSSQVVFSNWDGCVT